tara:strand:- start:813 stop:1751 length:939 start_codon:yes stop_codon:yes gene_type:complete
MKRNQRFEGMLREVQRIKSENYVGTKEAYGVLKQISDAESNPIKTANRINSFVWRVPHYSYPATPERVIGSIDILFDADRNAQSLVDKFFTEGLDPNSDFYHSLMQNIGAGLSSEVPFSFKPSDLSRTLIGFFVYANKKGVSSDRDFGESVLKGLGYLCKKTEEEIGAESVSEEDKCWTIGFLADVLSQDWEDRLSRKSYLENLDRYVGNARLRLKIPEMVEKLKRDMVDHRMDYRRQTVCYWLEKRGIDNYEEALRMSEESIRSRAERYEKSKSCSPKFQIGNLRKSLQEAKFIRHVLGQERNFLKRYLDS